MNEAMDHLGLQQAAHSHMLGVPPGLAALQPGPPQAMQEEQQEAVAKFKPIDLEGLSPK